MIQVEKQARYEIRTGSVDIGPCVLNQPSAWRRIVVLNPTSKQRVYTLSYRGSDLDEG